MNTNETTNNMIKRTGSVYIRLKQESHRKQSILKKKLKKCIKFQLIFLFSTTAEIISDSKTIDM